MVLLSRPTVRPVSAIRAAYGPGTKIGILAGSYASAKRPPGQMVFRACRGGLFAWFVAPRRLRP